MRESNKQKQTDSWLDAPPPDAEHVTYDEKRFFESFYASTVRGEATDRMTIGAISEMESRFHYNGVENSIIRGLVKIEPPPPRAAVAAWRMMRQRQGLRLLDIGSGTGHWVDFMIDVFDVGAAVAVEITQNMAEHLQRKYADRPQITVLRDDVADPAFTADRIGGPVHYATAIGVMFHIVDDARWRQALANLASVLADSGVLIVGGDFGAVTRDVQFHKVDDFANWREHDQADAPADQIRVNKRVRSLSDWQHAADDAGLEIVDLIRTERDPHLSTPENDVLLLRRARR